MSFTRAKNPAQDSGFELTNWKDSAGDITGYAIFLLFIAAIWAVVKNPGENLGNRARNTVSNLASSAEGQSGPSISVN